MNLIKSYVTNNPYYKQNQAGTDSRYVAFNKRGPQGLMLHSVGCAQPSAQVFINRFNQSDYDAACVHGFIDGNTGAVYQTMPWNYRAPHCGGDANNTHVGIEICEPAGIAYGGGATFTVKNRTEAIASVKRTYAAAVELFAALCTEFNLNPNTAILSHYEGYKQGLASGHVDPTHLWDGLGVGYTMDGFRKDVKAAMSGQKTTTTTATASTAAQTAAVLYRVRKTWSDAQSQVGAFSNLDSAKKVADANPGYHVFDGSGKSIYPATSSTTATSIGNIKYYKFTAGANAVPVYCDTSRTTQIGSLNAGESCYCIEAGSAACLVWYALDDGSGYKCGYVQRSAGNIG